MSRVEHWAWRLTIGLALGLSVLANFVTVNDRVTAVLVLIIALAGIVYALLNLRWLKEQKRALRDLDEAMEEWRASHGDHLSDL